MPLGVGTERETEKNSSKIKGIQPLNRKFTVETDGFKLIGAIEDFVELQIGFWLSTFAL
jgi:hypothetical protein